MSITIELPDEVETALREEAARTGRTVETVAAARLLDSIASEDADWWANLTQAQRQAEVDALRRSQAAADAGRERPLSEYRADVLARRR